jgi:hypothetical protein
LRRQPYVLNQHHSLRPNPLRHRIMPAPRERMAARQPPEPKPASAHPPVPDDRYIRVLAARWKVFALRDRKDVQQRRNAALVERKQRRSRPFTARTGSRVAHKAVDGPEFLGVARFCVPRS